MSYQCPLDLGIIWNFDFKTLGQIHSLLSCRQVCKGWDERISRNILKNQSRRQILRAMNWGLREFPSDEDIAHVKWLGKLFFNVKFLY